MTPQRPYDEPEPRTTRWEHFDHGAGIGVRGFGATKAEAFEQAGLALMARAADLRRIGQFESARIDCEAADDEALLLQWLNALVEQVATRRLVFSRFAVRIDGNRLRAQAWGEAIDPERHPSAAELKRAGRATLRVARHGEGWLAQAVVDA